MAVHYLSAVEFIKHRNFSVYCPAFYYPHLPEHMKNPKPEPLEKVNRFRMVATKRKHSAPFRHVEDPDQWQRANFSIEIMLDMFKKKVEFQIANKHDIPEIFEGLDRYLLSLQHDVEMGVETVITYARLVIAWRAEVYKHYYRYMQEHPAAKEKLYPNNDPTKNLLSLMASTGIRKDHHNLDPLRALAEPPYRIDKIAPLEKERDPDYEMGSSLGLSSNTILADDGSGFDFEDFLKRG